MPPLRPRGVPPLALQQLAQALGVPIHEPPTGVSGPVAVGGVTVDSTEIVPGDLFAALPGEHHHGAEFAGAARAAGAVAVLTDDEGADRCAAAGLPALVVADPRAAVGPVASVVYGNPSAAMTLVGITGTNGKTTTAALLEAAFAAAGHTTALLGTIGSRIAGEELAQRRTTPEAPALQALLAVARERGVDAAAMEVSSHALALGRVAGTEFAAGVFTNLAQDHLDFHRTMDRYFEAKANLFRKGVVKTAVVCVDDGWGERLVERLHVPLVTYSSTGVPWADWTVRVGVADVRGTGISVHGPAGEQVDFRVALPGPANVANALGALAAAVACGVDVTAAARGISSVAGIPGRLEPVDAGQPYSAFVDYAHTPAAVAQLLATLRPLTAGRLVVVLGCGGDRDPGKRAPMGRAAAQGSDLAVFTTDNPRSEDPATILAAMTENLELPYVVELDRQAAIARAVRDLGPGDTVVVAGKGHETGQVQGEVTTPFDDRLVLREAVVRRIRREETSA